MYHPMVKYQVLRVLQGPFIFTTPEFTTLCTEFGRSIIFYNERLDIATYPTGYEVTNVFTELCEVVVLDTV